MSQARSKASSAQAPASRPTFEIRTPVDAALSGRPLASGSWLRLHVQPTMWPAPSMPTDQARRIKRYPLVTMVAKRFCKRAVDRNAIKRRLREAYRLASDAAASKSLKTAAPSWVIRLHRAPQSIDRVFLASLRGEADRLFQEGLRKARTATVVSGAA